MNSICVKHSLLICLALSLCMGLVAEERGEDREQVAQNDPQREQQGSSASSGQAGGSAEMRERLAHERASLTPETVNALCNFAGSLGTVDVPKNQILSRFIAKFVQLSGGSHRNPEDTWKYSKLEFILNHYHCIRCESDNPYRQEGELLRAMMYSINRMAVTWFFDVRDQNGDTILITRDGKMRPQFNCVDKEDGMTLVEWLLKKRPNFNNSPASQNVLDGYIQRLRDAGAKTSQELENPQVCGCWEQ